MTVATISVKQILAEWDFIAVPGLCHYCGDSSDTVPLPFEKGKPSCHKCFKAICYGM